jgi:hypothetical protein
MEMGGRNQKKVKQSKTETKIKEVSKSLYANSKLFLCETYLLLSTLQFWQVRVPSPKLKPADENPKGL